MALDVLVVAPPQAGAERIAFQRHVAALEWDGYYLFLSRFWPASSSTGRLIDLHASTHFEGANLAQLRSALVRARTQAVEQPETWQEHLGKQTHPVQREIYATVNRSDLVVLLGNLIRAVDEAESKRGRVVFEGD